MRQFITLPPTGKAVGAELSIAQSIMKPKSQCKPTACQKNLYENCYTSKDQTDNEARLHRP